MSDQEMPMTPQTPTTPRTDDEISDLEEIIEAKQVKKRRPPATQKATRAKIVWPSEPAEMLKALKRVTRESGNHRKSCDALSAKNQKLLEKIMRMQAKYQELMNKPHRRRSPNLAKVKRQETAWMAACKIVAAQQGIKYLVPQIGTDVYKLVKETQAKLQAEEPERFSKKKKTHSPVKTSPPSKRVKTSPSSQEAAPQPSEETKEE